MLKHIYIKNFTIISELNLDLNAGFTVLTGETGAGKSIMVDALSFLLGERFDVKFIRHGEERCTLIACFDVSSTIKAREWLQIQELYEEEECIISRTITQDGRSRNTINGRPCSLIQLRELGEHLVHIHSQNQQYALLKSSYQLELLDAFAQHTGLFFQIQSLYLQWQKAVNDFEKAKNSFQEKNAKMEFWKFQLNELDKLQLKPGEIDELMMEHKQLSHAEQLIERCQRAYNLLDQDDQFAVLKQLHLVLQQIHPLVDVDKHFKNIEELIQLAFVHVQESADELHKYLENFNLNPERLRWIDQRLSQIQELARKYRVKPEELFLLQEDLKSKLQNFEHFDEHLEKLQEKINQFSAEYQKLAQQLSNQRAQAAKKLEKIVHRYITKLGMPHGKLQIQLQPLSNFSACGNERVEFLMSANPGQPLQPLNKIASGGELSRIALAIQVATAQTTTVPSLIFDEVDVGIGGGTAEIVGKLLKTLGQSTQILCVTHLPQVAAQSEHHLHVAKIADKESTTTQISLLTKEEKITEIARMLGGVKITQATLNHASEMIEI